MSISLIVLGNINQFTFANSVVGANEKSKEIFSEYISNIFVIHSPASYQTLIKQDEGNELINHLNRNNISQNQFVHKIIDINPEPESVKTLVDYLGRIVRGIPFGGHLMVDLTNGTSLHKNILSTLAYLLDLENQFNIDIITLSEITKDRGFLSQEIINKAYLKIPSSSELDGVAHLNLTEVIRYKNIIEEAVKQYVAINEEKADESFFRGNLSHSIELKMKGDISRDNSIYRIAASSIAASLDDLIMIIIDKVFSERKSSYSKLTLGQKLELLRPKVENVASEDFDIEFFKKFNDFILYLRNSTTHKGILLTEFEKFKAELAVKMSFPFIEFYTDIVFPALSEKVDSRSPRKIRKLKNLNKNIKKEVFYFGLDGDNTGSLLEEIFVSNEGEREFKALSDGVTNGINQVVKYIESKESKKNKPIIFSAGDDILFKGKFDYDDLLEMQKIYHEKTQGKTCSIGFGRSFQEVYLALKLAKSEPGKGAIIGIEFAM